MISWSKLQRDTDVHPVLFGSAERLKLLIDKRTSRVESEHLRRELALTDIE
jgi:hypothetical protein